MKNICAICHCSGHGASVLSCSGLLSSAEHHKLEQQKQNKKKKGKREGKKRGRRLFFFVHASVHKLKVWLLLRLHCALPWCGIYDLALCWGFNYVQLNWVFLRVDFNAVALMICVNHNMSTVLGLGMLCMSRNSAGDGSCVVDFHSLGSFCSSARGCNSWGEMWKLAPKFLDWS